MISEQMHPCDSAGGSSHNNTEHKQAGQQPAQGIASGDDVEEDGPEVQLHKKSASYSSRTGSNASRRSGEREPCIRNSEYQEMPDDDKSAACCSCCKCCKCNIL